VSRQLLILALLALATIGRAQVIRVDSLAAGAQRSTGAGLVLTGTVAQPTASFASGGTLQLTGGFAAWDPFPPQPHCRPVAVELESGTATIVAADVDDGSNDNRAVALLSVAPASFDETNLGENLVTLTVRDHAGHTSTCTATVTVLPEPTAVGDWELLED
jgi:hypothetical protein